MRLGTRNIRSMFRSGSLSTVARELQSYKPDIEGVQEVTWGKLGTARVGDYILSYGIEKNIIDCQQELFVLYTTLSAVKRLEFINDRMSYVVLRGRWCDIIVLKLHLPSEEKGDNSKDSFKRN